MSTGLLWLPLLLPLLLRLGPLGLCLSRLFLRFLGDTLSGQIFARRNFRDDKFSRGLIFANHIFPYFARTYFRELSNFRVFRADLFSRIETFFN